MVTIGIMTDPGIRPLHTRGEPLPRTGMKHITTVDILGLPLRLAPWRTHCCEEPRQCSDPGDED